MTGTALADANEYLSIYNLDVIEIPTNKPMIRKDHEDEVYRTEQDKFAAIVRRVTDCRTRGQPVLVGTTTVGKSEALSAEFTRADVPHAVLNARHHEREAEIIAQAGRPGVVTIATNMAGRGTDIQLGGNAEFRIARELGDVMDPDERTRRKADTLGDVRDALLAARKAGGLMIIGTERFFCRRVDDQLSGRAGRQGDPGASIFMLSLDDDLIRVFGAAERLKRRLAKLGVAEGAAMFHSWLTRAIRNAQRSLEAMFIESRRHILEYDEVAHGQRKLVYAMRRELMLAEDFGDRVWQMWIDVLSNTVASTMPVTAYPEQWNLERLANEIRNNFNHVVPLEEWAAEEGIGSKEMQQRIQGVLEELWRRRRSQFSTADFRRVVSHLALNALDDCWRHHIAALEDLRVAVLLRSYADRVPIHEYKREAFDFFEIMLSRFRDNVVRATSRMERFDESAPVPLPSDGTFTARHVKRVAPCPCGSGMRFKDCHGRASAGSDASASLLAPAMTGGSDAPGAHSS